MTFKVPEKYRIKHGPMSSSSAYGNNGAFFIPSRPGQMPLRVVASDGGGWEHVSVSLPDRCPTWLEMCAVKALFWEPEDLVLQYHPPRSEWVSNHRFCLHMWRPIGIDVPKPPQLMVGIQALGELPHG